MTHGRRPRHHLKDLLDELAEDALGLSDEEVRAEVSEDGGSVEASQTEFRTALAAARTRSRQSRRGTEDSVVLPSLEVGEDIRSPEVKMVEEFEWETWPGWGRVFVGPVDDLMDLLPEFDTAPLRAHPAMREHPDLQMVVRKPMEGVPAMAVGQVSREYSLVQHAEAVSMIARSLQDAATLDPRRLMGELSLSRFGAWMNLSFFLPKEYSFRDVHGCDVEFRCSASNSVDGSSRLHIRFDWFRKICSNGMVVAERRGQSLVHRNLDLKAVRRRVRDGCEAFETHRQNLEKWQNERVADDRLASWADAVLCKKWRLHAAARVLRICSTGQDPRFGGRTEGPPSELVRKAGWGSRVLGSPRRAATKYDVAQAMSWVASRRPNIVERIRWQRQIPDLLKHLKAA